MLNSFSLSLMIVVGLLGYLSPDKNLKYAKFYLSFIEWLKLNLGYLYKAKT